MKKFICLLSVASTLFFVACSNQEKKGVVSDEKKADSLYEEVMDGHNVGMAKTVQLSKMQTTASRLLDSLEKLPEQAKAAAAPFKEKLQSLANDLNNANDAMNKWMEEFNLDSAKDNVEQRLKYLTDENIKVKKVKEDILNSLQKGDSLLKSL